MACWEHAAWPLSASLEYTIKRRQNTCKRITEWEALEQVSEWTLTVFCKCLFPWSRTNCSPVGYYSVPQNICVKPTFSESICRMPFCMSNKQIWDLYVQKFIKHFFLGLTESTFIFTEQRSAGRVFCLSLVILYHRIYRVLDIQVCKHILLKISTEVTARAPHCCQILTCTTWPECVKPSVLQRLHSLSQSQLLLPSKAAVNGPQSLFSGFRSACTIHLLLRNHRGLPSTEILDSSIMRRSTTLKQLTFLNVLLGAWHGFGFASGRVTHSQMKQE